MKGFHFYGLAVSFFAGTLIFSFADISLSIMAVLFILSLILALVLMVKRKSSAFIAAIVAAFALGALRIEIAKAGSHDLDTNIGKKISLSGYVCDEPADKERFQSLCFKPDRSPDRVIITAPRYPKYAYGDEIRFYGSLEFPKNFLSYEGGPEFDYISYLAKDGIRYSSVRPKLERTGRNRGNIIMSFLFAIKGAITRKMKRLLPEPEASLLGGLLLGDRQSMPKAVAEDFKRAGLVHMLVLSGYNVTVVAESLMKMFSFLPRAIALSSGAASIVLFALMTGASSTTIRASAMALIAIAARFWGRKYDVTRALVAAAFFMVLQNPRILAFDVSFELSFMATLALLFVSPLIAEQLTFITEWLKLRETISTTLATQIFVLPFLLYVMGQTSVIALISNPFVLPAVPYSMLGGFISVLLGFLSERLAYPIALLTNLFLAYILKGTALFAALPFALIRMSANVITLALSYAAYTTALIFLWRRRNSSRRSAS